MSPHLVRSWVCLHTQSHLKLNCNDSSKPKMPEKTVQRRKGSKHDKTGCLTCRYRSVYSPKLPFFFRPSSTGPSFGNISSTGHTLTWQPGERNARKTRSQYAEHALGLISSVSGIRSVALCLLLGVPRRKQVGQQRRPPVSQLPSQRP